jgi:hypothetical protein
MDSTMLLKIELLLETLVIVQSAILAHVNLGRSYLPHHKFANRTEKALRWVRSPLAPRDSFCVLKRLHFNSTVYSYPLGID